LAASAAVVPWLLWCLGCYGGLAAVAPLLRLLWCLAFGCCGALASTWLLRLWCLGFSLAAMAVVPCWLQVVVWLWGLGCYGG